MRPKYILVLVAIAALFVTDMAMSQPWFYDFGTSTGSHTTGVSTTFLPAAPSGTARVRIGSGGGSFDLENQTIAFGSGSYLRGAASTSTSFNKVSVYDYTANLAFTLRFTVRFGASNGSATVTAGSWYLFVGDGAIYSDNNQFAGAQVFTGLQWVFAESGAITTSYRNGSAWSTAGLSATPFAQGTTYTVEIYGNNSAAAHPYTYGGSHNVAANTFDLWVNGALVGDDLAKALLPNEVNIDSWLFYGGSSASNAANIFLDSIFYTNDIAETPLPVQLTSFVALRAAESVTLSWSTVSEVNNYGFYVERRGEHEASFAALPSGFVAGHGTTLEPQSYRFEDITAAPGTWYYRLRQVDIDGTEHLSDVTSVQVLTEVGETRPTELVLSQNYPNPFNPSTTIRYSLPSQMHVTLTVQDLLGRVVRTLLNGVEPAGAKLVTFNGKGLASGTYVYRLLAGDATVTKRMLLLK